MEEEIEVLPCQYSHVTGLLVTRPENVWIFNCPNELCIDIASIFYMVAVDLIFPVMLHLHLLSCHGFFLWWKYGTHSWFHHIIVWDFQQFRVQHCPYNLSDVSIYIVISFISFMYISFMMLLVFLQFDPTWMSVIFFMMKFVMISFLIVAIFIMLC